LSVMWNCSSSIATGRVPAVDSISAEVDVFQADDIAANLDGGASVSFFGRPSRLPKKRGTPRCGVADGLDLAGIARGRPKPPGKRDAVHGPPAEALSSLCAELPRAGDLAQQHAGAKASMPAWSTAS